MAMGNEDAGKGNTLEWRTYLRQVFYAFLATLSASYFGYLIAEAGPMTKGRFLGMLCGAATVAVITPPLAGWEKRNRTKYEEAQKARKRLLYKQREHRHFRTPQ